MHWVYLALGIVAEVMATTALKAAEGFTRLGPSLLVIVGYSIAFYCVSLTLKTLHVGVAYAIWSGVGIVLAALVARIIYGQRLDSPALFGMGLIVAGVLVIHLGSKIVVQK